MSVVCILSGRHSRVHACLLRGTKNLREGKQKKKSIYTYIPHPAARTRLYARTRRGEDPSAIERAPSSRVAAAAAADYTNPLLSLVLLLRVVRPQKWFLNTVPLPIPSPPRFGTRRTTYENTRPAGTRCTHGATEKYDDGKARFNSDALTKRRVYFGQKTLF